MRRQAANLRDLARDRPCMVRLPGCHSGDGTTVLAHIRIAGLCGMGLKPPDVVATYACSHCHDLIDGRVRANFDKDFLTQAALEGMARTLAQLWSEGYRMVKSA